MGQTVCADVFAYPGIWASPSTVRCRAVCWAFCNLHSELSAFQHVLIEAGQGLTQQVVEEDRPAAASLDRPSSAGPVLGDGSTLHQR